MATSKKNTGRPLRLLIVEDSEDDVDLLVRELRHSGFEPSYRCVKTADDLIAMLDNQQWDLVIGDYTMPGFSGTQALSIVRSRGVEAPFIFVSGTIGEDVAVTAMRAGAQDYVIKGNLKRLGPAIERELRESDARHERVRADAERRLAEDRFRQILMIAADAIIGIDEDLRIVIFNRGAEAMFGYRASEVMGQLVDLIMPSRIIAAQRLLIAELASSPADVQTASQSEGFIGLRKNGEEFPTELTISKLVENGKATFTGIIRDISGRKRAEAERMAADARFREVLVMAPDAIVAADEDRRITIFNRAAEALFGYSAEEVLGQILELLLPSRFVAAHPQHLAEFARAPVAARQINEMGKMGKVFGRRKNGEEFPAEASISKIVENGKTTFMAIVRDITQRQALEEQHRRSQRLGAIGQLTGGIAHDFNNLLTVTVGNLDLLLEEPSAQNSTVQEFARTALDAALRGASLTGQLLAFASGQVLESAVFDLNELVSGTTNLLRRTLGEHIKIETALAGDLWLAHADPKQLETALTNLAINARDAMPSGGRLTIETANRQLDKNYAAENAEVLPGEYVMLAVSDTGTGMAPEIVTRVFEPFYTTKEPGKGTGLGLSMVYGFVKQSHGHINIYSETGHGTTIRIYLPRAQDGLTPTKEKVSDESGMTVNTARILVVDDNTDVRGVVVKQLTGFGYGVIESQDGSSALDIIRRDETIDLLFTDIVMPGGMTGIELAREARKIRPLLKILLTSGFAEASVENGNRSGEALNILSKPYRRQELARKIQEVLTGKI